MSRQRRSPVWSIPPEEFRALIETSQTMTEVLAHFGMKNQGNNHQTVKNRCLFEGIDISSLKERARKHVVETIRKRTSSAQKPISELMTAQSPPSRYGFKNRLIQEGVLENVCSKCGLKDSWQGEPIVLVLDHINGNNEDNRRENLRLLCPNCNSQTSTFCGRKKPDQKYKRVDKKGKCCDCGCPITFSARTGRCSDCASKNRRKNRPTKENLQIMLAAKSKRQIAKDYGVSDTAVGKWAKEYGIV